jgi:site-specific DNA-methyltransferase (adenine-specific)
MEIVPCNSELARYEKVIAEGLTRFVEIGEALAAIKRQKLYVEDYQSWTNYTKERWGFTREHCRKLMEAAKVFTSELIPLGDKAKLVTHESQVRALLPLKAPEDKRHAFEQAAAAAGDAPPTAQQLTDAVRRLKLRQHLASKHPEKFIAADSDKANKCLAPSIICGDSLQPDLVPTACADLICGSPPYNLGVSHPTHQDDLTPDEYERRRRQWLQNFFHWAKEGGRLAINVPIDVGKPTPTPLGSMYLMEAIDVGWKYLATIVWNEGSHKQWSLPVDPASRPRITCSCELILLFSKGTFERPNPGIEPDISSENSRQWMQGYWDMPGAHASKAGHPCPYPSEIPRRLIQMLTWPGDVVVDPWMGSGTTIVEAAKLGRRAIGIDFEETYCELARANLAKVSLAG